MMQRCNSHVAMLFANLTDVGTSLNCLKGFAHRNDLAIMHA